MCAGTFTDSFWRLLLVPQGAGEPPARILRALLVSPSAHTSSLQSSGESYMWGDPARPCRIKMQFSGEPMASFGGAEVRGAVTSGNLRSSLGLPTSHSCSSPAWFLLLFSAPCSSPRREKWASEIPEIFVLELKPLEMNLRSTSQGRDSMARLGMDGKNRARSYQLGGSVSRDRGGPQARVMKVHDSSAHPQAGLSSAVCTCLLPLVLL